MDVPAKTTRGFVSQLIYLEEEDVIVSGSGDGTLRAWNYHDGQQLSITDCRTHLDHHSDNPDHSSEIQTEDRENGDRPSSQDSVQKRGQNDQGIDLKCLVHCQQEKLIVVGFERLQLLLVYKYVCQSSDELSIALTFRQKLLLSGDFWDMTFDTKGHLWVLQAYKDKPLEVFQTNSSDDQLVPLEAAGDKRNFLPTLTAVSQKWHLLKDCGGGDGLFSVLHKIKVDNAQFYRERKHQRLEEQKRRHKAKKERKQTPKEVSTSSESLVHHQTKPSILATSGDWKGDLPECKKTKLDG